MAQNQIYSYGLWKNKKPTIKYFRVFDSQCYILQDHENSNKFNSKSDEWVFLEYISNSKTYRGYNLQTKTIKESINIVVDDISAEITKREPEKLKELM